MSNTDATPDPFATPLAFGQRLKILRTRRGMSRELLAGLLGRSSVWVKHVEYGILKTPSMETVLQIAEALRVRDLRELTGGGPKVELFAGAAHPRLAAVADAVNRLPLGPSRQAAPPAHLRARLDQAWAARHQAPNHREVIGALLPDLIRDGQLAVRQAESGAARRAAQAILSEVYSLSQFFLAYQPGAELLWRVAERGMIAAQESEDPHALGVAAWLQAEAHRDSGPGHYDAADDVTAQALAYLDPLLPDAGTEVVAIAGALRIAAGYTAARRGDTGFAWGHWDQARRIAVRLPETYYHPITSFGQAIMGAHAVTVAVELHAGGESARQAARAEASAIPSRPRRARHRIEQARAYALDGQPDVALATLDQAHEAAPETIRYNGYAKRLLLELGESKQPQRRQRAADLAVRIGLLAG